MPLYEYECEACAQRFEVIQKSFSDAAPDVCRKCGKGPVRRLMSSPAIQFKGSGFYITDYAKKGTVDAGGSEKSAKSDAAASSDAGKASSAKESATGDSAKSDSGKSETTKTDTASKADSTPAAKPSPAKE